MSNADGSPPMVDGSETRHHHGSPDEHSGGEENVVLAWVQHTGEVLREVLNDNRPIAGDLSAVESLAVFDVVNAIHDHPGYVVTLDAPQGISEQAAIAGAAFGILSGAYPELTDELRQDLRHSLASISDGREAEKAGVAFGKEVADAILAQRQNDLHPTESDNFGVHEIGIWRSTPPDFLPANEPQHGEVRPFALTTGSEFRPGPPPALTSQEYAQAFQLTKDLGAVDSTARTADQTEIAQFWSNDIGTYTPGGHLNDIALHIAADQGLSVEDSAGLFAELNVALADALIACWDAKYVYDAWRPITAIRQAGRDGNPATDPDHGWTPLLDTPNHPEYASGHAAIASAAQTILANFFGDDLSFSAISAALPGVVRSYDSFTQMAQEDAESRIFGGVHFQFSADTGLTMGQQVGDTTLAAFDGWQVPAADDPARTAHFTYDL